MQSREETALDACPASKAQLRKKQLLNARPRPTNNKCRLDKFTHYLHFLPFSAASIPPLCSLIDVRVVHITPHFHNGCYVGLKEEKKILKRVTTISSELLEEQMTTNKRHGRFYNM